MRKAITTLAQLKPDRRNANRGTKRGGEVIDSSIAESGLGRSIVVDKTGEVIAGNKTLEAALRAGILKVKVVQTDGTELVVHQRTDLTLSKDARAQKLALADNRASELGLEWNPEELARYAGDLDLSDLFDVGELAAIVDADGLGNIDGDPDAVPPVPSKPKTNLGDLYILGNHRLLCGDATSIADVNRLVGDRAVDMVCTDPPYGVKERTTRKANGRSKLAECNDFAPVLGDSSIEVAVSAYQVCVGLGIPLLLFWGANYFAQALPHTSSWVVWDKREGKGVDDNADCELAWTNRGGPARLFAHMWKGMIKASERGQRRVHPTQKPVALAEWCIGVYPRSRVDVILDLFGGSGSTLIACESLGRHARIMELDPGYCDVIVTRWELATGRKAKLEK